MPSFFVEGKPETQGSMMVMRGRVIHSSDANLRAWRTKVAQIAKLTGVKKVEGAVTLTIHFHLLRPKTITRAQPFLKPDLDKLIRAIMDALTGVAYTDDGQVVSITATKEYSERAGAWIEVTQ